MFLDRVLSRTMPWIHCQVLSDYDRVRINANLDKQKNATHNLCKSLKQTASQLSWLPVACSSTTLRWPADSMPLLPVTQRRFQIKKEKEQFCSDERFEQVFSAFSSTLILWLLFSILDIYSLQTQEYFNVMLADNKFCPFHDVHPFHPLTWFSAFYVLPAKETLSQVGFKFLQVDFYTLLTFTPAWKKRSIWYLMVCPGKWSAGI